MSITVNNNDSAAKKNTDEAMLFQAIHESMLSIKHKFLFVSSQGEVGKTTVIVRLAMALSKKGAKVGLMDLDFNNPDIHKMLGLDLAVTKDSSKRFMPVAYSDELKIVSIESVMRDMGETASWENPLNISDILRFICSINWSDIDYLFVDTPQGPGARLPSVIRAIPDPKIIIVTAPDKVSSDNAKKMINFFRKEEISIFGWIENMRGFLCQNCGQRQELCSTGPSSRAIFLNEVPFLGRIPIDAHLNASVDTREASLEKYTDSQAMECYNLITKKIMECI